jgi:hypothetical protein
VCPEHILRFILVVPLCIRTHTHFKKNFLNQFLINNGGPKPMCHIPLYVSIVLTPIFVFIYIIRVLCIILYGLHRFKLVLCIYKIA